MKNIIWVLLLSFVGVSSQAQEAQNGAKKNKNAKYTIEVNGNCELCKKRIEKASFGVSGVKSAVWDVDSHQLSLILNEEKCSVLEVKKALAKAGHDTDEVKATNEDYEKLHTCCRYTRN